MQKNITTDHFPEDLREVIELHRREFAGARMELDDDADGAGEANAAAGTNNENENENQNNGENEAGGGDEGKLGESGVKALRAERDRAKAAERASRELGQKVQNLETLIGNLSKALGGESDDGDGEADIADKVEQLHTRLLEREAKQDERARRTAVVSAAKVAGFNDPADAARYLDLSEIEVTDGEADEAAANAAIKKLAEEKPYLIKATNASPNTKQLGAGSRGKTDADVDLAKLLG